jgi:GxxExxY protein
MNALPFETLTGRIIGCAIQVHRKIGPGFLESIYENALAVELGRAGLQFEQQKALPVRCAGILVDEHRLDLLVENTIVTELKAVSSLEDIHLAIVRSYVKAAGPEHGLLLNYAAMPLAVKRGIFRPTPGS